MTEEEKENKDGDSVLVTPSHCGGERGETGREMKVAVILLSCLAFATSSRRPYPSRYPGSGGGIHGGGSPIVFPDEIKGSGGGGHIHPQPGVGGGVVGGGSFFPPPVGHGGEPLVTKLCPRTSSLIHDSFLGHNYHFSWCADGGQRYIWQGARDYCTGLGRGWYPVAIDTAEEDRYIINIVGTHQSPWIWTGGNRLDNNKFIWKWLDGRPLTYFNWGQTGSQNLPQPDNAENNNEQCLALLNQFYPGDLITFHDIGCHHTKPTICEYSDDVQVPAPQRPVAGRGVCRPGPIRRRQSRGGPARDGEKAEFAEPSKRKHITKMLWCVVVVMAAVVAASQGQFTYNDAAPSPPRSFVITDPASAQQPAVVVQPPTFGGLSFVPPPQPSLVSVTQPGSPQLGLSQGLLPPLPTSCPSTSSLVHAAYHGSLYHFSWCYYQPYQRFTHQQAADYCGSLNHFGQPYHFQVLRIDDSTEISFIHYLLSYYAQAAVWTIDTTATAPYSLRRFINRSGVHHTGHDCLSVEASLLALHSIWVHENACSDAKLVVCEARY
ncbi:hypothetical protein O3P69_014646 [Scylla paramamosain]|uniref:C-type lectin domain-containing protein n=1 Tax=Scylla paramamosain TaxID=85552 RepID=A0AAW0TXD7_SCYPA